LRNDLGGSNRWLKVKLIGTKSNRSAIGARVTCFLAGKRQAQEVTAQSSFYSSNDPRLHFGLGDAAIADLEVRWPCSPVQILKSVKANQIVTIREP
jgi:hypothetical protein